MKKQILRYTYPVLLTGVLFLLLALCVYLRMGDPVEKIVFQISMGEDSREIKLFDDRDYSLYAFLPAQAEPGDVTVFATDGVKAWLEDQPLNAGLNLAEFETDTIYSLRVRSGIRTRNYRLTLLPSQNTASLFVDTRSGKMNRIHSKKGKQEDVFAALYDDTGTVYRSSGYTDTLSGHGNTTWGRNKKPYNLNLSAPADLLGSGAASKWILLANYLDATHLRGDMVYRLARETTDSWTTDCRFVELYLNGEYVGLYQLTDRVEAAENRLELREDQVLLNLEIAERANTVAVENLFPDISAEIRWPEHISTAEKNRIDWELRRAFDGLTAHTLTDDALTELFDVDSWAWLYLIQEISCNYDAGVASLYFYTDHGKIIAGPAWDYDNALGSWAKYSPVNCFAEQSVRTPLWRSFLTYEPFRASVARQYRDAFAPRLEVLLSGGLNAEHAVIAQAKERNYLRWHPMNYKRGEYPQDDPADAFLLTFLERRKELMDDIWLRNMPVCHVRIEQAGSVDGVFGYYTVTKGTTLAQLAETEHFDTELLTDAETGEKADISRPITVDTVLRLPAETPQQEGEGLPSGWRSRIKAFPNETAAILTTAVLAAALVVLAAVDIRRRR